MIRPTALRLAVPLLLAAAALGACASSRSDRPSAPSAAQASSPSRPPSPAHPLCMYVERAGDLVECYNFAFGRCVYWGPKCETPGPIQRGPGGATGAGGTSGPEAGAGGR